MCVFEIKKVVDWKKVSRLASKAYGKPVSSSYCRDVWNGHHDSSKLKEIIGKILNGSSSRKGAK